MVRSFDNAPLIEMSVEIRWLPSQIKDESIGVRTMLSFHDINLAEEFFNRFSDGIASSGFVRSERLFPKPLPIAVYQPIYQFFSSDPKLSVVFQLGMGVLIIKATNPYKSWDGVAPFVAEGVRTLLSSQPNAETLTSFTQISVRYVDAFTSDYFQTDSSPDSFIRNVLGFGVNIPNRISSLIKPEVMSETFLKFAMPFGQDPQRILRMSLGAGVVNNNPASLMEISVSITGNVLPTEEILMNHCNQAHSDIHNLFIILVEPFQSLLKPMEGENDD